MKRIPQIVAALTYAAVLQAQTPAPAWELGKNPIAPATTVGKVELTNGVVKLDGANSFAVPAVALGSQENYTIEFEVKRPPGAKGGITFMSNADAKAKTGIKLQYYPPDYNACWLLTNGNMSLEYRGFLDDKFDKISFVVAGKKLSLFRNGLILAMTDTVNPSDLPLTFGSVEKAPLNAPYELRNLKVYAETLFPTGFDQSVERMRNYSGDGYFIQRVDVKDPKLPRILVVGDSISMGYRGFITERFKGKAYVDYWVGGTWFEPGSPRKDNSPVKRGWDGVLSNGPYDVISWNPMTLHMWTPQQAHRCNYETFPADLAEMVAHFKKTAPDTKFIWIRCTPYTTPAEGKPSVIDTKKSERLVTFNSLADTVIKQNGIPEIDLWGLCEKNLDKASKDGVHWNQEISKMMAAEIIAEIEKQLAAKGKKLN